MELLPPSYTWGGLPALRADAGLSVFDESLWNHGYGSNYGSAAGMNVSPDLAMKLAAVYACVRVVSETIASLPFIIYRRLDDGGKERATDHPLYKLFRQSPNGLQTSFDFFQTMQMHLELRGNSYAFILPGPLGAVDRLISIHPDRVKNFRVNFDRMRYEINDWYTGQVERKAQEEIFHVRGQSQDGLVGQSTIAVGREIFGLGLAQQDSASRYAENDSKPGGTLNIPTVLSPEKRAALGKHWQEAQTQHNRGKVAVLEGGMKYEPITVNPKDSQFLESRQFTRGDIASMFRVPPHKIGDLTKATFSNIEQQSIEFVTDCIAPRAARLEMRINMDLIEPLEVGDGEEYFGEFLLDSLLRGDLKSRYEAYVAGRNAGVFSINDIRKKENMNPVDLPEADDYLRPLNFVPIQTPVQESQNNVPITEGDPANPPDPEQTGPDDSPDAPEAT